MPPTRWPAGPGRAPARDRDPAWAVFGAMFVRDVDLAVHAVRSTDLSLALAADSGLVLGETAFWGLLLHDVGMLDIPVSLLRYPGRFDSEHHDAVTAHPGIGAQILAGLAQHADGSDEAVTLALRHHERWDGTGYPSGLAGRDIPLTARLLAVADVYTALTAPRPYRGAHDPEDALVLVSEQSGTAFDPVIVRSLKAVMPRLPRDLVQSPLPSEVSARLGPRLSAHAERGRDVNGGQMDALFAAALGLEAADAAGRLGRAHGTQRTWSSSLRRQLAVPPRLPLIRFLCEAGRMTYSCLRQERRLSAV